MALGDTSWSIPNFWALLLLLGAFAFGAFVMSLFSKKNQFEVDGKTLIVTGASQGMGREAVKQLAAKGANILIVARSVDKLQGVVEEMRAVAKHPTQRFTYVNADVTKGPESARIVEECIKWNNGEPPDTVWCIAGVSHPRLFLDATHEQLRDQMEINFWAATYMVHAILKVWLSPEVLAHEKPRHFVFTASTLAFYAVAGYAPYTCPKAAIRSLCDTLHQEIMLYTDKVKIHTVFPGGIDSPGFANENITKPDVTKMLEADDPVQSPQEVASRAISGLEHGNYFVNVSFLGHAMKACSISGSPRNNWFLETIMTWICAIAWIFIAPDMEGKIKKWGKTHGHPNTYPKPQFPPPSLPASKGSGS